MPNLMKVALVLLSTKVVVGKSTDDSTMMIQQRQAPVSGPTNPLGAIMDDLPRIMEAVPMVESFLRGHGKLTDGLRSAFSIPVHNVSAAEEIPNLLKAALVQSGALRDAKDLAERMKSFRLEADSVNIGLSRAFAIYPEFTPEGLNEFPLHHAGGVSFFLNIVTHTEAKDSAGNTIGNQGDTRICMAVGASGSLCFSGDTFKDAKGDASRVPKGCFKGSEFGGEDFYLGFAQARNVPGWSWAFNLNHDYINDGLKLGLGRLAKNGQDTIFYQAFMQWFKPFAMLSSLSGGMEFTHSNDFVAINFEYCIFGKSQGGQCNEQITHYEAKVLGEEEDPAEAKILGVGKSEEIKKKIVAKVTDVGGRDVTKEEMDQIRKEADTDWKLNAWENAEKFWFLSKETFKGTTFEAGAGKCWCSNFVLNS